MRLSHNVIAGMGNSALTALLGLAATPFYLHFLGVEAYGLVGFFVAMQALLSLLDLGLSPTMNREVARAVAKGEMQGVRSLLHSLGMLAFLVAVLLAGLVVAGAAPIASYWLSAQEMPTGQLSTAISLMGVAIACRWPAGLYQATVNGAERLIVSSTIASAYAAVATIGSVCVLTWVSPTIGAFFVWHAFAALMYTLFLRAAAWRTLGGRAGAIAGLTPIRRVWRFSAGMGVIAVTSVLFTHMDKLLLSAMLTLESFGRYTLATMLASGIYVFVVPVFNAVYPRFSALVAAGDGARLLYLYSIGTRIVATLVFPLASVLLVFSEPLLALWTQDAAVARSTAPVLALLVAGTALHSVMYFPYALQLAHGRPRITVTINLTMLALLVPTTVLLTMTFGEIGAAGAWLLLHAFHLAFGTRMTHRHLLRGYGLRWLTRDVGVPLLIVCTMTAVAVAGGAADQNGLLPKVFWATAMLVFPALLSLGLSRDARSIAHGILVGHAVRPGESTS